MSSKRKGTTTPPRAAKRAKQVTDIAETITNLEKSRDNERKRFKRCILAAEELYHQVFKFMIRCKQAIRERGLTTVQESLQERYNILLGRLSQLESLTWREQTRGPTSSRSWKAGTPEEAKKHPALWILWTPPPERNIPDEDIERTLNEASGPYLTWGLPKRNSVISLDTDVFKKGVPTFVIEKFKVADPDSGKSKVCHRIKGLYFIFRKIKKDSTKMSLMTWEHVVRGFMADEKVEKSEDIPDWVKD
jgi:hypothetical protein